MDGFAWTLPTYPLIRSIVTIVTTLSICVHHAVIGVMIPVAAIKALSALGLATHVLSLQHEHGLWQRDTPGPIIGESTLTINGISYATRAYWMRRANLALKTSCPFAAFGSVIVNHTAAGLGELVCTGANSNSATGNPTLHGIYRCLPTRVNNRTNNTGEMVAISNCSAVLTDPDGPYKLTPSEAIAAFSDLSLYTNAESCPMCASAIRWAGFKEYIYGTTIDKLIEQGWGQIRISSIDVFRQSFDLPNPSRLIGSVLANETDPYFLWQFNPEYPCPAGCLRVGDNCAAG